MSTLRTRPGNGGRCFHPGDDYPGDNGAPRAGANICFHPGDDVAPSASVSPCFHPGDDEPAARSVEPVSPCFHPVDDRVCFHPGDEDAPAGHPGDDLAVDLHLSVTGIDERQLAVLADRRP